jgi:hypothetical protein
MMHDKFSAELRRHLLETADERPADGQLAAVVEGVAAARQRHPAVARLTWSGRVGPFPSAVVRYGLIGAALIGALLAGALIGAGGGPARGTVFEGTWTTTDPGDGSGMLLVVARGNAPAVYFEDPYASGAACVADRIKRFTAVGAGSIIDGRLHVTWPDGGGCGLVTVPIADGNLDHDPRIDALVDADGLIWIRVDVGNGPPRRPDLETPAASTPSPERTPDATAVSECIDLASGTYTAPVGPWSVTATVPSSPLIAWHGWPNQFELASPCTREAISILVLPAPSSDVLDTSCMPDPPEVASFLDAVARLETAGGPDIAERVDLVIDGHPAARFDVVELRTCPEGFGLWGGSILGEGETGSIYVIDVDGSVVAIELNRSGSESPAALEEAYAIVASLQFSDERASD